MKKSWIFTALLIVVLVFSFTGCGNEADNGSSSADGIVDELSVEPDTQEEKDSPDETAQNEEDSDTSGQTSSGASDSGSSSGTSSQGTQSSGAGTSSSGSGTSGASSSGSSGSSTGSGSSSSSAGSAGSGSAGGSASSGQTPDSSGGDSSSQDQPTAAEARAYIGRSASSMIADIGSPTSSQYSPSCMGDGDDGELYYGDFTVYTYREDGQEQVVDVE